MSVKERLLELLEDGEGDFSGEELSKKLGVSRNAVWKAVKSLREEGFVITAATNRGYKLERGGDLLSVSGIKRHLSESGDFKVEVYKKLPSTNTFAREAAAKGAPEGLIVAAEEQTAGKGRMGRSFYSPAGKGVYFSVLLRPKISAQEAVLITSAAAVAAARAIESDTGVKTGIKWVNDLFCEGKKVCGILTEAAFDLESGLIESSVLGIGINVTRPAGGYPAELDGIAAPISSADTESGVRNRIIAETVNNFMRYYKNLEGREFLDEYRERSIVIGREITVLRGKSERQAYAQEIDDRCGLVVCYDSGETETLSSGEVSIRYK